MKEIWKTIPFHENYEISSFGRVRNINGNFLKLMGNTTKNPYFTVELKGKKILVHRMLLMAFCGMPDKNKQACHKNDIKTDNRLENLYWGTPKENKRDAISNDRLKMPKGEDHHNVKISQELVTKIRSEYAGKRGEQSALGRKYGLKQQHVNSILNGKIWKHLNESVH